MKSYIFSGHGTGDWVRLQSRHLVVWNHGHRAGHRNRSLPQVPAHEGPDADPSKRPTHPRLWRRGQGAVQTVRKDLQEDVERVPSKRSFQKANGHRTFETRLLQEESQRPQVLAADAGRVGSGHRRPGPEI